MLSSDEESTLWAKCRAGDMASREELIIAYRPLVFWIAGKIHISDSELKQDMVQEGMLALINAVDKFDPAREYKFTTYAYHKIHGAVVNLLERGEKRAPLPVPDEWLDVARESEDDTDSEDWLSASEAVSRLSGKEAEVVSAMFFEGKDPKTIAHEQKVDISHVYRLKRSAIARIRGWLGLEGV